MLFNVGCASNDISDHSWFIRHHKDYGNTRFVVKRVILPIAAMIYVMMVIQWSYVGFVDLKYKHYAAMTDLAVFLLIISCILVISCKTPRLHDVFNIRGETNRLMVCVLVQLIGLQFIIFISHRMGMHWYESYHVQSHWLNLTAFVCVLVQTLFVFRVLETESVSAAASNDKATKLVVPVEERSERSDNPETAESSTTSNRLWHGVAAIKDFAAIKNRVRRHKVISIEVILGEEEYFELFMDHMLSEFSSEVILSLIEFQQFQELIVSTTVFEGELEEIKRTFDGEFNIFELNKSIPKSSIVHNTKTVDALLVQRLKSEMNPDLKSEGKCTDRNSDSIGHGEEREDEYVEKLALMKEVAHRLYLKYVAEGSEFEINISYFVRSHFVQMMQDHDQWILTTMSPADLLNLFQDIKLEMLMLLDYSYQRFVESDAFRVLLDKQ